MHHKHLDRGVSFSVDKWTLVEGGRSPLGGPSLCNATNTSIAFDRQGDLKFIRVCRTGWSREAGSPGWGEGHGSTICIGFVGGRIDRVGCGHAQPEQPNAVDNGYESVVTRALEMALGVTDKFALKIPESIDNGLITAIAQLR